MPQRVTKTDEAYVQKQLKRPHDTSGDIFEIRRIVLNNLGHKVNRVRRENPAAV